VKSQVKAGKITTNHNQAASRGLKVQSGVRVGGRDLQHNQTTALGTNVGEQKRQC